jgi:hypothetical protein
MTERTIKNVKGKGKVPVADIKKAVKKVKEDKSENNNPEQRKAKAKSSK